MFSENQWETDSNLPSKIADLYTNFINWGWSKWLIKSNLRVKLCQFVRYGHSNSSRIIARIIMQTAKFLKSDTKGLSLDVNLAPFKLSIAHLNYIKQSRETRLHIVWSSMGIKEGCLSHIPLGQCQSGSDVRNTRLWHAHANKHGFNPISSIIVNNKLWKYHIS